MYHVNTLYDTSVCYSTVMDDTPNARLKEARIKAGFETAKAAADKFRWHRSTYAAHENGQNGLREDAAERYAKAFGVTKAWLLLGILPGEYHPLARNYQDLSDAQKRFVDDALGDIIERAKKYIR